MVKSLAYSDDVSDRKPLETFSRIMSSICAVMCTLMALIWELEVEAWRLNDICRTGERYYKLSCVAKSLAYSDNISGRKPFGTFYVILRPDRHLIEDFLTRMIGHQAYNALLLGPVDQSIQNRITEIRRIRLETEYGAAVATALSEGHTKPTSRPIPPSGDLTGNWLYTLGTRSITCFEVSHTSTSVFRGG